MNNQTIFIDSNLWLYRSLIGILVYFNSLCLKALQYLVFKVHLRQPQKNLNGCKPLQNKEYSH